MRTHLQFYPASSGFGDAHPDGILRALENRLQTSLRDKGQIPEISPEERRAPGNLTPYEKQRTD